MLLALVQYYYNLNVKKLTALRRADHVVDPFFRDLIISPRDSLAIDFEHDDELLHAKLKEKSTARSTESEVEQCLKAALAYKITGKVHKALKLFEHAAVLAPNNPDVLNKYGEFLEQYQRDVITADELYFKALAYDPEHEDALTNRRRTAHVVDQMDYLMFKHIDEKRVLLKNTLHLKNIDLEQKKQAFYLHIYHTVGIEGNTMTISELQYLLETGQTISGKSIVEHNEVLGLEIALRYVKVLANIKYIELSDIFEIHRRVMGHVDPLSSGVFRNQQVFVGSHVPPPPEDLQSLMEGYIEWLNSEEALSMHPVRLAALAHYKLVDIHPFADGNGRTSRLIMNLILLRSGYPPVIIYKEDRVKYYEYLTVANGGDVRPFVRFIAYCTDETLNTYLGLNNRLEVQGKQQIGNKVIEIDGVQTV